MEIGNKGDMRTWIIPAVVAVIILAIVIFPVGDLFGHLGFLDQDFSEDKETIGGLEIFRYDIVLDSLEFHDGKEWVGADGKFKIGGEEVMAADLKKEFVDYFYEREGYEGLRNEIIYSIGGDCTESYVLGFEKDYVGDGRIYFGSGYGHVYMHEIENQESEFLGNEKWLDYFYVAVDGKIWERSNVNVFSFKFENSENPSLEVSIANPFNYGVGVVGEDGRVEIAEWILNGKISYRDEVYVTPDLMLDMQKINGIDLSNVLDDVKEKLAEHYDVGDYWDLFELGEYELRLFYVDDPLNCKNVERNSAKKNCDAIYQFYDGERPVELWYKVSRERIDGSISESLFASDNYPKKETRYTDFPKDRLDKCELKVIAEAERWRDSIVENPIKFFGSSYCPELQGSKYIAVDLGDEHSGGLCL